LNNLNEDPASRAQRYITTLTGVLEETRTKTNDASVAAADIRGVSDSIQRYLRDTEHYLKEERPSTALASVAYAEGLLDALVLLGLATVPTE